ncbi:hypothetical protein PVAG01_00448 [Phlyctema vagabunda]|uniref:Uncharacterized protein n=1 Tax=Phlyctema vagabunda TaxID=108571 RepID=A0ABR4PUJ7_9HELO
MSDPPTTGPSLILTQHENAHREHLRSHQHHHQNLHHNHLHRRQEDDAAPAAATSVITEVTQTISVVQQINVDSNGSTFGVETHLAESTLSSSQALTDTPDAAASSTTAASPIVTSEALQPTSTEPGASASGATQSLSTSLGSAIPSSTLSIDPTFSSLSVISNSSSTFISSSSSFSSSLVSNSTTSSSTSSTSTSLTFLTSSSTSSFLSELSTSSQDSTTLSSSFSTTSPLPTSTGDSISGTGAGSAGASTGVESSSAPSSTSNASGDDTSDPATPTPVVVGSVVGSIAGFAVILLVLLVLLRWWKKKKGGHLSLSSTNPSTGTRGVDFGNPPVAPAGGMSERRSIVHAIPAALSSFTGINKRDRTSRQTDRTLSSTAGSERGFYRVSGRKLPSVLQHGGDGYGDSGQRENTMSGQSFYRDSQGFYGGDGGNAGRGSVLPNLVNPNRESAGGIPIMRPGPARTPVTQQGPFVFPSPPRTPPQPADMVGPDAIRRSNISQDGSHASRFTEEV